MIPADHIHFNDDGTAWVICPNEIEHDSDPDWLRLAFWHGADRPCDTCDGETVVEDLDNDGAVVTCEWCDGTGRHTFDIEVVDYIDLGLPDDPAPAERIRPFRVSVVLGMVLPICPYSARWMPEHDVPHFSLSRDGTHWTRFGMPDDPKTERTTLPPAAKPGMWTVKLEVHDV